MILFRILFSAFRQFLSVREGKSLRLSAKSLLIGVYPEYSRGMFNSSLRPLCLSVQSKLTFATLLLCVQFLSLQAGFSFTPLPLEYDCAYLTLSMELDATTFDCVVGPGCSVTMTVWVSVHDSALNELYGHPITFSHPCDLFPDFTYNFLWAQGWFDAHGFIEGDTYWVQLELLSFAANTSATETYLFGNNLKVQLEPPVTYVQPEILTTQSFVYSPMAADFNWKEIEPVGIQAKANTIIELESTSEIYGDVDYRWYLDGKLIGTDSVITYSAPCFEHTILLEVEQVPGGCIAEKKKVIPAGLGCVSPLREIKRPFLPSVIGRGEEMVFPEVSGREYQLVDLSGRALPLDTRGLSVGIYYLRIIDGGDFWVHKFLVR